MTDSPTKDESDVGPAPRRCEVIIRGGCRCRNRVAGRANGLWVCAPHKKRIERTFAVADQRWKDAGEPESDL